MKKFKRFLALALVLALFSTAFIGCGGSSQTAQTPSAPSQTEATDGQSQQKEPAGEVITLRVAYHEPATSPFHKAWEEFGAQLEEKTNGQCKLQLYPGEQLGKGADMVSMIANNITDIGWMVVPFFPGQFPITEVLNLPMMGVSGSKVGGKSLWDLYQITPEMQEEWAQGMHLITFTASGYQFLNTMEKPVFVPDDIKGLKIRVAGSVPSRFIELLGGSPVSMPPPDMYEALDKGVIDGYVLDWMGINSFKLQDVTKNAMTMPFVSVPKSIAMTQSVWDSLPDNVKAVFDELGGAAGTQLFGAAFDDCCEPLRSDFLKMEGRQINEVSDEQKALWEEAAKPIWDDWAKTMDEKGLDGQKLIETFREIVENNSKEIN